MRYPRAAASAALCAPLRLLALSLVVAQKVEARNATGQAPHWSLKQLGLRRQCGVRRIIIIAGPWRLTRGALSRLCFGALQSAPMQTSEMRGGDCSNRRVVHTRVATELNTVKCIVSDVYVR